MREITASELLALSLDLETELDRLKRLESEIQQVQQEIERDPTRAKLFYENQALKLHNFYTGCERIFSLIASELNGGVPSGFDWHKRLLQRMKVAQGGRPALLSAKTAHRLEEYLGFRHVVRNVYGFELDVLRVERLVVEYFSVWHQFESNVRDFIGWLEALAEQLGDF